MQAAFFMKIIDIHKRWCYFANLDRKSHLILPGGRQSDGPKDQSNIYLQRAVHGHR